MVIGPFGEPINQPVQWVAGVAKIRILGLLDLPHFGRGHYANIWVKQVMEVTHGGYLWLEKLISIDVELIAYITGLPSWGEDPTQFLEDKTKEKALVEEMNKEYNIERGSHEIIIRHISDTVKIMATKIMACKLLRKCCKEEFLAKVVATIVKYLYHIYKYTSIIPSINHKPFTIT
jgi:hypothetical protein